MQLSYELTTLSYQLDMDHFFMMVQIVNDNGLIPVNQSGTHVRVTPNIRSTINHNKFQKMNPRHI